MNETLYSGIDIGSQNIKIMTISYNEEQKSTKIISKKTYQSRGVSLGYIDNPELFFNSLKQAIDKYKTDTKLDINEVILTISLSGLKSENIKIIHQVINQDSISEIDIIEIERKAKQSVNLSNKHLLDLRLFNYKIQDYTYYSKDIIGLNAKKLEANYTALLGPTNFFTIFEKTFEKLNIIILKIESGNIISAENNVNYNDRDLGFLNIDIGAEITTYSI
jgi:cell division protein FtsA